MTDATPEPIISGVAHKVVDVNGRPPAGLDDFVDGTEFTLEQAGRRYQVMGCGLIVGDTVRFHEKDMSGDGKDIRVWQVGQSADGHFVAEHMAIF